MLLTALDELQETLQNAKSALARQLKQLLSPPEINDRVRAVMSAFVTRHGFLEYRSYVAKAGRARFIEISVLLPPGLLLTVPDCDALRAEIGTAIGGEGPDRWLTIMFTADPACL